MSFQIHCPHCNRVLNVTEKAFGKVLPCPGCQQPMSVPQPDEMPASASVPEALVAGGCRGARRRGHAAVAAAVAGRHAAPARWRPASPRAGRSAGVCGGSSVGGRPRFRRADGGDGPLAGANMTEMFLGQEKEHVFPLFPGEQRLDELTISISTCSSCSGA